MKTIHKNILHSLLFLSIGLCLLLGVSRIFEPKKNLEDYGILNPDADGILAEPENSLDLVFVGDSESYWAFQPLHLWKEYGIASYVCGTRAQCLYTSEEYVRKILKSQNPRYLVLETDAFYREYDLADAVDNALEQLIPALRYHHRWRYLTEEDFTLTPAANHRNILKGFVRPNREIQSADATGYMAPSDASEPIPALARIQIHRILRLCRRSNTELILMSTRSTLNWSTQKHNAVSAMARELGLIYLDLNRMPEEVPIDWNTDTWDGGDHLNLYGSNKVSAFCGRYFAERGLPDHRGDPAWAHWEEDWKSCYGRIELANSERN